MNPFDNVSVAKESFAYNDLVGQGKWENWTPTFSLTAVGTPTYSGRFRQLGRCVQFQVKIVPATSIATTAGTSYMDLPVVAKGYAGIATMTNDTTNVAVGVAHIDVANSRCYPPTQGASGNTFTLSGFYEV